MTPRTCSQMVQRSGISLDVSFNIFVQKHLYLQLAVHLSVPCLLLLEASGDLFSHPSLPAPRDNVRNRLPCRTTLQFDGSFDYQLSIRKTQEIHYLYRFDFSMCCTDTRWQVNKSTATVRSTAQQNGWMHRPHINESVSDLVPMELPNAKCACIVEVLSLPLCSLIPWIIDLQRATILCW